jgi:hypothetical protein
LHFRNPESIPDILQRDMEKTPSDFIELGRLFRPHDPNRNPEESAAESYLSWSDYQYGSQWPALIQTPGIHVILGEAGSGRTYEFKGKANALRSEAKKAFYLSLHKLVSESLADQMSDDDKRALSGWQQGEGEAFFFLDAVDESKLTKISHFREALDKFVSGIGPAISRARVFISSRVKDWFPATDRRNVVEAFGLDQQSGNQSADDGDDATSNRALHVWSIAALDLCSCACCA